MRVAAGLAALLLAVFAVPLIRFGLRDWRCASGARPISQRFGLLVDEGTRAGYDRSSLIIGMGFAFMAVMLADFAVMDLRNANEVEAIVFAITAGGMIICFWLVFFIISFNRPKSLVPSQHRGELGAFAAQRRRRKGRHAR